jgi:uncharacterized delta-60 repeat protein
MKKILVTILAILSFAGLAFAAPGDLDLTFNGTGKVTTSIGTSGATARTVAVQSDGKIVVVGHTDSPIVIAVARYNPDGSLDTSFDGDGRLTTPVGSNTVYGLSVAIQSDGKIVVGATDVSSGKLTVVRYNSLDGSLDTTFDTDGIAQTPNVNANSYLTAPLAIQSDGKIIIAGAGFFSQYDFAVARFNSNGSPDTSFDTDGVLNTSFSPNQDYPTGIAVQTDGKIVVGGGSRNDTDGWDQIAVARYNADGTLDTTFDGDGKLTTTVGLRMGSDVTNSVAIQSNGKIVVGGTAAMGSTGNDFMVVRYNADGSLDSTFDADGKVTTSFGGGEQANAIVIQPDGKIVAAGVSAVGSNDFAVARYNSDGSLDSSLAPEINPQIFGSGGKVTVDFTGGQDIAYGVALDSAGRILATGITGTNFGAIRLQGLVPSAANVSISGRVLTSDGRGLNNAIVSLTDANGNSRSTRTGSFGFYRFDEIEAGQIVIVNVRSKRFQFEPRVLSVGEDLTDVDFTPTGGDSLKKSEQ